MKKKGIMKKKKKLIQNVFVYINRRTSLVEKASCVCPAGKAVIVTTLWRCFMSSQGIP